MKSIISFPFRFILALIRIVFVGFISGLFCVYTVDYLTSSAFGTKNLVIITFYFSSICTFSVIFVEMFLYLQRKSKKTNKVKKDTEKYGLK